MITRNNFSTEQEAAFVHMTKFLRGLDRQMVLQGFAGTGKTTLLKEFISYLDNETGYSVICTAPTNEAVRVISNTTGEEYSQTIYGILGLALVHENDSKPVLRAQGKSKLGEYDIVIIDEASMIDSELFSLIQSEMDKYTYVKVIFIGDEAQLPPVKDEGTCSKVFSIENKVELTEVQRVAADNPIISTVTKIRENLLSERDVFDRNTNVSDDGSGIEFWDDRDKLLKELYKDFKSDNYKKDSNYVRAALYTNKAVNALNIHIRRHIFEKDEVDEFEKGENIIADQPIMRNMGNFSKILYTVGQRLRVQNATLKTDNESGIKYWLLKVINYEAPKNQQEYNWIKVVSKDSQSKYDVALRDIALECKQKIVNGYNKRDAWKPYFQFKEEWSKVKYAYAVTVHKLQGSTIDRVYVIERDLNKLTWDNEQRNKLKYVAFTRASNLLRILQ